jgi:tetrapyrrole methylase family protein / MazG family protein
MTYHQERGLLRKIIDPLELIQKTNPEWLVCGYQVIPASIILKAYYPPFTSSISALIELESNSNDYNGLQKLLTRAYPAQSHIALFEQRDSKVTLIGLTLSELGACKIKAAFLFLPLLEERSSLEQFMNTVTHLRAPEGCPWDKKQTHASLRTYLMEETFEALEAIDREDTTAVREELGDILLQIALHSVIASETGAFNLSEVIAGIDHKIISRHPHVFGDVVVEGERDVLVNWDKLKREEKEEQGKSDSQGMLDGIPAILPALSQAQALQQRAARVGFDWPEIKPVLDKVFEELEELRTAPGKPQEAEELGDLLFALVNLVRWYGVDAESALRQANQKFRRRFAHIEKHARESGKDLMSMTLDEMDLLWEEAKRLESKTS